MKFRIQPNIFTPDPKEPKLNRFFLDRLARDMVRILKTEIKKESFKAPATDLIRSWKYSVKGQDIVIWSDHPALTGEKVEEEVEEEKLDLDNIDLPDDPREAMKVLRAIPNVAVIQDDGKIEVRKVTAKKMGDEWVFPPHKRTAFLERAKRSIMKMIRNRIQSKIREAIG